jgi:hypothetical protein
MKNVLENEVREAAIQTVNKHNSYVIGNPGCEELRFDDLLNETPDKRYERCEAFIRDHETDHFRTGADIVYVGDEGYPDGYSHMQFIHHTEKYDTKKNEYDVTRTKHAFKKVGL